MKRLFFIGFFFFGMIFSVQPQAALAAAGDSCAGDNKVGFSGTCQTYATCGGDINNIDSSSDCSSSSGLLCCKGSGVVGTPTDPNDVACLNQPVGGPCPRADGGNGVCEQISGGGKTCLAIQTGARVGGVVGADAGTVSCPSPGVMRAGICIPGDTGLSSAPVGLLLMRLMNWLLAIFGTLAIIAFVISGIQYLVSAGNEEMIETAKRNMWYSIVGVVVALSGWIIIITIDQVLRCSFVLNVGSLSICF